MPFDNSKYYAQATKGEVAGVALKASSLSLHVASALLKLKAGEDISEHIEKLNKLSVELDQMFDSLTGYTPK